LGAVAIVVALLPDEEAVELQHRSGRGKGRQLPPLDTLFFSALWLALGWALVEVLWGSIDFWKRMALCSSTFRSSFMRLRF